MNKSSVWVPIAASLIALCLASLLPSTPALGHRRKQAVTCDPRCEIVPPRTQLSIPPGALAAPPFQVPGVGEITHKPLGEPLAYQMLQSVTANPGALVSVYGAAESASGNNGLVLPNVVFKQGGILSIKPVPGGTNPGAAALAITSLITTILTTEVDTKLTVVNGLTGPGVEIIMVVPDMITRHNLELCSEWTGTVRVAGLLVTVRNDPVAQPAGTSILSDLNMRVVRCLGD